MKPYTVYNNIINIIKNHKKQIEFLLFGSELKSSFFNNINTYRIVLKQIFINKLLLKALLKLIFE